MCPFFFPSIPYKCFIFILISYFPSFSALYGCCNDANAVQTRPSIQFYQQKCVFSELRRLRRATKSSSSSCRWRSKSLRPAASSCAPGAVRWLRCQPSAHRGSRCTWQPPAPTPSSLPWRGLCKRLFLPNTHVKKLCKLLVLHLCRKNKCRYRNQCRYRYRG